MKRLALWVLALGLAAAGLRAGAQPYAPPTAPVEDVAGWESTRWGMTPDELAVALGSRFVVTRNQIGLLTYSVSDATVGGVSFTPVMLTISPGRGLTEVRLGTGWVNHARNDEAAAIEAAMRNAYGPPHSVQINEEPGPDGVAAARNVGWNFPTTSIQLRHWYSTTPTGVQDLLSISYLKPR